MTAPKPPEGIFTRDQWPAPPGATRRRRGRESIDELSCDVLVIGSGAGGAVVAAELAEAGHDVLVLEEGSYHDTDEFNAEAAAMVRKLYRDGGLSLALGDPPLMYSEGRCVGGTTVVNGGMSWRTPERVLGRWTRDHGIEAGSPAAMQPYFERVERFISARVNDEHTIGRDNALMRQGAEQLGWHVIPNVRNQNHCAGSNNCAFGCPTGAKQSALVSYLPRALRFGARIYADCRAERIMRRGARAVGAAGHVVGADGRPGHAFEVRARDVVVAAGAIHTPVLLTRSGFRSPSGQLGRNLGLHPNAKLIALFDDRVDGYQGAHQVYQVREFENEGLLMAAVNVPPALLAMSIPRYGAELGRTMARYNWMVCAGVMVEDTTFGRVRALPGGHPLVTYQLANRDAQMLVRGTALVAEIMFAAGARRIILPFDGAPDLECPDDIARLRQQPVPRRSMEVMSVHVMGTARIGSDPQRHVCDSFGRFYGASALHVADASLFPSPIGVNPMETVMALATRTAERILDAGLSPA